MKRINSYPKGLDIFQKISVTLMMCLVLITFVGANLHAIMWQSSSWLVSTVLPAVVVNLTNEEREDISAPILQRNTTLDKAAQMKADHMAKNEYFSHYSPDGVSPWYWFDQAGYSYAHAGENLAIHFTDSSEVVKAWMNSPTHRANIVNSQYLEIGVGTAKGTFDGYETVYVVQLFGTQAVTAVTPSPVEVAPEVAVETIDTDITDIQASIDELSEAVAELNNQQFTEEVNEEDQQQVLAESTEVADEDVVVESTEPNVTEPTTVTREESQPLLFTEPEYVVTEEPTPQEVLVVESTIATSSGLTAATVVEQTASHAGATVISMVTQPNELLQWVYLVLGMLVMALLLFSAVFEARKLHYMQVAYSATLMISMGALWYVHSLLTSGAVII